MYKNAIIIDGYVDEPASFGVPPYIGTYPRYIAGILKKNNISYKYYTIDNLRANQEAWQNISEYDLVIVVSGMTVPGKYIGGAPIDLNEIQKIGEKAKGFKIIGGPIKLGYSNAGKSKAKPLDLKDYDIFCYGDIEAVLAKYLENNEIDPNIKRDESFLKDIAVLGADIIKIHPNFPYVIAEIESSRGCEQERFCSYCTEPFYGKPDYRDEDDIISEVEALYNNGARYFRIGRQSNILAYKGAKKPNVSAIKKLYEGIRKVAPDLKVLHTDNANPAYIAKFPKESYEILSTIAKYNTPGDIVAFGVESFDENVINENFLRTNPDDVIQAVEIVNRAGSHRINGVPKLLPGINLIYGLIGESKVTYKINYEYLQKILEKNLMIRRINIRKVMAFPNTYLGKYYEKTKIKVNEKMFRKYKKLVREEIDSKMLKKVFPAGETVLKDVIPEYKDGNITFGRQLGTYPILIGIRENLEIGKPIDVLVSGHGYRSITGIKIPFDLNTASLKEMKELPGVGQKRAKKIIESRPFTHKAELEDILEENYIKLKQYIKL